MEDRYDDVVTAILVDGGFYRKRAYKCIGDKKPKERADELESYCRRHLTEKAFGAKINHKLYRIFYYDCPPSEKIIYNPLTKQQVDLSKSNTFTWANEFFDELKKRRKFALRLGKLNSTQAKYTFTEKAFKDLCSNKRTIDEKSSFADGG